MITQNGNSVPSDVQAFFASKVGLVDDYVLFQTGTNQWAGLVQNRITKKVKQYTFTRDNQMTGNAYHVVANDGTMQYTVTNEMYAYSNVGSGRRLECPVYDAVTAFSLAVIVCVLSLGIVFKGALFRCIRR